MANDYLEQFKVIYDEFCDFNKNKVPLCAAETYVSDFVKQALSSDYEGKYIQGYKHRDVSKDNIGSIHIYKLMCLVEEICNGLYNAKYVDARTLSGMNCITIVLSALVEKSQTVLITEKDMGGHASLPQILNTLGIRYKGIPYDYEKHDIEYNLLNQMIREPDISHIVFCQSDLIKVPDFKKISIPSDKGIIYDASQTLGLIAARLLDNPLDYYTNSLLIGGSHKTLPGPTCGLVMTNSEAYISAIDTVISPTLLRNIQPNNIAALALALIEQEAVGVPYQKNIVSTANLLGNLLQNNGLNVLKAESEKFTHTHQLFIELTPDVLNRAFERAVKYGITLNKKNMKLFTGIRIGVQEIARYGYSIIELEKTAKLIRLICQEKEDCDAITTLCRELSAVKRPQFILDDLFM